MTVKICSEDHRFPLFVTSFFGRKNAAPITMSSLVLKSSATRTTCAYLNHWYDEHDECATCRKSMLGTV